MSIRESFVQHFGEATAARIEEASIGHQNDDKVNHGNDRWGKDPFKYHLLNCISHQCLTKWATWHQIDVPVTEMREWALEYADLYHYDGDIPDYIGMLAGAYMPWINWAQNGEEPPAELMAFDKNMDRWDAMTDAQKMEEIHNLVQMGLDLLNEHSRKDPSHE